MVFMTRINNKKNTTSQEENDNTESWQLKLRYSLLKEFRNESKETLNLCINELRQTARENPEDLDCWSRISYRAALEGRSIRQRT